jgi:tripeptide aminopeptidase
MASPIKRNVSPGFSLSEIVNQPLTKEIGVWFARERHWITEQHVQLCRVPAPTFLEGRRAEWMVNQLRSLGCEARVDRGGNVIATLHPNAGAPYLAISAHLDTVLAPRLPEDIRVEGDGTIRGPGVSDNGAGLAALLAIAKAFRTFPLSAGSTSLLLVANVGEEGEGNLSGMRYLCQQSAIASKVGAFIVLDGPTLDHITCQALASKRFEITYSGSGGHSWSDFGVGNPIHALSRAISLFSDAATRFSAAPRTSYNFGTVQGGSSINSIATEARAKLDIRSQSASRIDELVDVVSSCVEQALQVENERSTGSRVSARVKEIGYRPGGSLAEDAPLLEAIRSVDRFLGIRSHLDCASTDANIPLSLGIPAISIGAGGRGGGAHTPAEWFHPEGREIGLKRILLTALLLLQEESRA